ncbi:MAG: PHP domain-containing protein [Candidatus Omnitrophota bacterium]
MQVNKKDTFVDLHIHTAFSDGTFSPEETVAFAQKKNLAAIAITDHDCVDAIPRCIKAAKGTGLEIIPGIELAAQIDDLEIHLLGLCIDWQSPWFLEKLKEIRQARLERMRKMIEKLNHEGIDITEEDVLAFSASSESVGRLHLARALLEKGKVDTFREVFERYIGDGKSCYVRRLTITFEEGIRMIRELKGIVILAHPAVLGHDELIPELAKAGLMGIETIHSDQTGNVSKYYARLARQYGLVVSGGSDCHGMGKGHPLMGALKVPYSVLENIKKVRGLEYNLSD